MDSDGEAIKYYDETINDLVGMGSYYYAPKKLYLDLKTGHLQQNYQ